MDKIFNEKTWKDFLDKLSGYKGSVSSFCKENSITKGQFYYYKKRFSKPGTTAFHAISVNNEKSAIKEIKNYPKESAKIKIEIGNAKIHIPTNEPEILSILIRELVNHAEYR